MASPVSAGATLIDSRLVLDERGRSTGHLVLHMSTQDEAATCIRLLNGFVPVDSQAGISVRYLESEDGRRWLIAERERKKRGGPDREHGSRSGSQPYDDRGSNRRGREVALYIGNMPPTITEVPSNDHRACSTKCFCPLAKC
jgi:hypothetical protein